MVSQDRILSVSLVCNAEAAIAKTHNNFRKATVKFLLQQLNGRKVCTRCNKGRWDDITHSSIP